MTTFKIEVTDTYDGEANYCWVRRYSYQAKTERGAIQKLAREHGAGWRKDYSMGDMSRYNLQGAAVCLFIEAEENQP